MEQGYYTIFIERGRNNWRGKWKKKGDVDWSSWGTNLVIQDLSTRNKNWERRNEEERK